ncbi:MAG: adaptor protein MecA [Ruminococcus sp.]|nr:adaptor protein MecA [Ruminococcus sp.]
MKISQLSHNKVLISLCDDDMKNFELKFDEMGMCDPHSKKIINRLLTLACSSNNIETDNKTIICEALKSDNGCVLFV